MKHHARERSGGARDNRQRHAAERRTSEARCLNALPQDLLSVFFQQMAGVPLLTADEEIQLAKAIEAGKSALSVADGLVVSSRAELIAKGRAARDRFVAANLRLVVSMAAEQARRSGVTLDDLVQDGTLGLIHAVDKFDWRRGYRFSTYATWWIRRELQYGAANASRTIRLPLLVHAAVMRLRAARARLERETGQAPTVAQLALATNLSVQQVLRATEAERHVVSLDMVPPDGQPLSDVVADGFDLADHVMQLRAQDEIFTAVRRRLDERSWQVVSRRFGIPEGTPATLDGIGTDLGISRETVRLILNRSLDLLRDDLKGHAGNAATTRSSPR